jgi:hypothetical protein
VIYKTISITLYSKARIKSNIMHENTVREKEKKKEKEVVDFFS